MGLDMYLYAEKCIAVCPWVADHKDKEAAYNQILGTAGIPCDIFPDDSYKSAVVKVKVGYWRKANQIHNWFVTNVQSGTDDCGYYDVPRDKLESLRDLCRDLLSQHDSREAEEKLPPQGGFFFGSTDVDDYYWADLELTAKILDRVLALEGCDFTYHSSW